MSSWANRHVFPRRDISKIPDGLRPVIVGRADRPEVILSETFQNTREFTEFSELNGKTMNEILYPKERNPIKKIENFVSSLATELVRNGQSYVFVILRNLQTARDNDLWITSYNSIRKWYKNKIIIIDDNSQINTVNGKLVNTDIIYSEWNGAGEVLPYYYFLQNKWADRMIFMHDSMFLHRRFTEDELDNDVAFHWHFVDDKSADSVRKISNYLSLLPKIDIVNWKGCFGAATMISYDIVMELEEKYKLFSVMAMNVRTRKDRQAFERVFGIVLYHDGKVDDSNCSNFGDIKKYPSAFESQQTTFEAAEHILNLANYDTAIMKVWRGR
jgi:hypothetical protein